MATTGNRVKFRQNYYQPEPARISQTVLHRDYHQSVNDYETVRFRA